MLRKSGFTLIELLIVVAIIAILAAIAIPNFLQAQIRAKVSRAQAEMQTLATALESYEIDNNTYPLMRGLLSDNYPTLQRPEDFTGFGQQIGDLGSPTGDNGFRTCPVELTTPIAYIATLPTDPFKNPGLDVVSNDEFDRQDSLDLGYVYSNIYEWAGGASTGFTIGEDGYSYGYWRLCSIGPSAFTCTPGGADPNFPAVGYLSYDPTNGTVTLGNILRTQVSPTGQKPIATPD